MLHPLLQQQYALHRARLEPRCEQHPAERVLYHGTSAPAVPDICAHGFNRSFCGRNGEARVEPGSSGSVGSAAPGCPDPSSSRPQAHSMGKAYTLPSAPPCRCKTATRPPTLTATRQCSWHGC